MPSVTFLGTGPGSALPGRGQASILLQTSGGQVLLDAGEPCGTALLTLGYAMADLDAVWITHAHPDHVGGLPMLLQASSNHGRKDTLSLGLPAHLVEPLSNWLNAILLPSEIVGFPLDFFSWTAGQTQTLGDLSITPWPTTHLDGARQQMGRTDIESFLFDIHAAGQRVIYSGDIGSADDLAVAVQTPVDVLICELAHVTLKDLIAVLAPARIGMLCLTHLGADMDDSRGEIKETLADKLQLTDAIYLPDDGERFEF
jgi:ribonuclease BN (tRNA processing enzyme)